MPDTLSQPGSSDILRPPKTFLNPGVSFVRIVAVCYTSISPFFVHPVHSLYLQQPGSCLPFPRDHLQSTVCICVYLLFSSTIGSIYSFPGILTPSTQPPSTNHHFNNTNSFHTAGRWQACIVLCSHSLRLRCCFPSLSLHQFSSNGVLRKGPLKYHEYINETTSLMALSPYEEHTTSSESHPHLQSKVSSKNPT